MDEVPGGQLVAYLEPDPETVELLLKRGQRSEDIADEVEALFNEVVRRRDWRRHGE